MWKSLFRTLWLLLLWAGFSTAAIFTDSDFQQQSIARPDGAPWDGIVGIQFSSDGKRLFAWERTGRVWVIDEQSPLTQPIIDLSDEVLAWRDHGLLGFALDPDFAENGRIYLNYIVDHHHLSHCQEPAIGSGAAICDDQYDENTTTTETKATIGRVTRYTLKQPLDQGFLQATEVDYDSRKVLIGETAQTGMPMLHQSHGVGQLVFGTDGSLLVAFGDGASFNVRDVGSAVDTAYLEGLDTGVISAEENVGAYRAQVLNSLGGKILRINPNTGDGYPSNPFYQNASPRAAASRVWALGVRNPYRFSLKPGTGSHNPSDGDPGVFYVGDVGLHHWEELNILDRGGLNLGWPIYEGMGFEYKFQRTSPLALTATSLLGCDVLYSDLIAQQSLSPLALDNPCDNSLLNGYPAFAHHRPELTWSQKDELTYTPHFDSDGDAVTVGLGDAIPGTATVPASGNPFLGNSVTGGIWYRGTDFPEQYQNTYFFGDFGGQWLRYLEADSNDKVTAVHPFATDAGGVVFITSNPVDGGLYYVSWASILYRISYAPGGNRPPTAVIDASAHFGPSPLDVDLSAANSSDPEEEGFVAAWDFGDGATATGVDLSHQFVADSSEPQSFTVTLTVSDNGDPEQSDTTTTLISVNNTPPQVQITTPQDNSFYPLGADLTYQLRATIDDAEHSMAELSCGWQVELFHNNHTHADPVIPTCDAEVQIAPVGCDGEEYHYEIRLTVTDDEGLATTDRVRLYPDCEGVSQPLAEDDSYSLQLGQSHPLDVLDNDLNLEELGDLRVTLLTSPALGMVELRNGNEVWYTPFGSAAGNDGFRYQVGAAAGGAVSSAEVGITLHNNGGFAKLAPVQISPDGGEYEQAISVTMSHPQGDAQIRFSSDGSAPDFGATVYSSAISVTSNTLISARAYLNGWLPSEVSSADYRFSQQLPPSLQQGLIGYWPLDAGAGDIAWDFSGSGFDGVIDGARWDSGWNGGALRFDGDNDLVAIDDEAQLRFGKADSFTISAWVKADGSQSGWTGVITKARENGDWYGLWISDGDQWTFGGPGNLYGTGILSQWQHLLLKQDGGLNQRQLYVDGILVESGAAMAAADAGDLLFGAAASVDEYFSGLIDEVRIYDRAVDGDEIEALATIMPTVPEEGQITAASDSAMVAAGASVDIDVLANDSADDGLDPSSVAIIAAPSRGSIDSIDVATGVIRYTPSGDNAGSDSFSYQVADLNGELSLATTVLVTISGDTPEPSGLVGYWPLDSGTAVDLSGNGHHGVVSGAQQVAGRFGDALQFDGSDDLVRIADAAALGFDETDSYSLSLWVQADTSQSGWRGVVTKGRELRYWYGLWLSAANEWTFGGRTNVYGDDIDNQWHHLMLVQNGGANEREIYLDGVLMRAGGAVDSSDAGDLLFGGAGGVDEFFAGRLDQVRLFNRALPSGEIAALASELPDGGAGVLLTNPDSGSLLAGGTVTIDVLANDSASAGFDPASVMVVTAPALGSIESIDPSSGAITYMHTGAGAGSDSFVYQVQDQNGQWSEPTSVAITISVVVEPELTLLAYWPLDSGSAVDVSGNGFDGRVSGASADPAKFNGGLRFDGVDDRVTVDHDARITFARDDDFSLSVWVKADLDSGGWRGIVTKSRDDAPWYGLWLDPGDRWVFGSNKGAGYGDDATEAWHHVVLVQDGSRERRYVYVDGVQQVARSSSDGDGLGDLIFGDTNGASEPFKGVLDDIRLYGEALSAQEVQALMVLIPGEEEQEVVTAGDDIGSVDELDSVSLALLLNDTADSGFDPFSWELITPPQYGAVVWDPDAGLAEYQHQGGGESDSFEYRVSSNDGNYSNTATVSLTIIPFDPPTISLSTVANEISTAQPLQVFWQLGGDQTAFNHLHLSLDGKAHVTLHDYSGGSYDFGMQEPGVHTIRGWLVDGSHLPVGNEGSDQTISITVYAPIAAVSFSEASGSFDGPISVSLSNADGNNIHFTTDGSAPTAESELYVGPIYVDANTTIKAVGVDPAGRLGSIATANYLIASDDGMPKLGLMGYWSFDLIADGQLLDSSGNDRHGSNNNGVAVQGHLNGALYFNGSDAFVEVADSPELHFGADDSFTMSIWVFAEDDNEGWTGVVTKSRDDKPWYGLWIAPWNKWIFGGDDNVRGSRVDQRWRHIVLRQQGDNNLREIFVDGRLVGMGAAERADGSGVLWFGGAASTNEFFHGMLDEVRIYNRSLTNEEMSALRLQ